MTVRVSRCEDGAVLRLVLDRPKGNVLTMGLLAELSEALAAHRDDPHLKLVLISGANGNFSYGASVEEHRRAEAPAMLAAFHAAIRDVAAYPVPVAALVQGVCFGGAFELALVCHFVLATPSATFACPEIKLGVFPPVLAAAGHLRLGGALAESLLLTGGTLGADFAERVGFAAIVEEEEPDRAALHWFGARLRPLSAFAIRQGTKALRSASGLLAALGAPLDAAEKQYVSEVLESHDGNEGIEAFLARRPPRWLDR